MATVEALKDRRDIDLLKTVLKQRSIRDYLMFIVGCNTGLRISDILKLKVDEFVNSDMKTAKKSLLITEKKTGKQRQIAVNGTVQKAIKLFITHYSPSFDEFLFASRKGSNRAISTTQAYRILNSAASACKIDINFGTHTLRKTWGYWTYTKTGNNLGLVMNMLGHSSPAMTLLYIGITQSQKDETYMMVEV
jgi:integrase